MKKILLAICLFGSAILFAQNDRYRDRRNNPPTNIQQSFERDYPTMNNNNTRWARDNNNQWHATYKDHNNRNVDAYYDRYGKRKHTHTSWNRKDMPREVDDRVYRVYHTRNYRAIRVERPNDDPLFQITLNVGGRNRVVYMDEQGRSRRY